MKRFVVFLLTIGLIFTLAACGSEDTDGTPPTCTEHIDKNLDGKCDECGSVLEKTHCAAHTDSDGDGKCDECGKELKTEGGIFGDDSEITLIKDSVSSFRFVIANDLSSEVMESFEKYYDALKLSGITIETVADAKEDYSGTEVLIGSCKGRGEKYQYDKYSLGKEGYLIAAIDGKILVEAGSFESLSFAIEMFFETVIGVEMGEDSKIENATYTIDNEIVEVQKNYSITDILIGGKSVKDMVIAADEEDSVFYDMALILQDSVYTVMGKHLDIVPIEEAKCPAIIVRRVADDGKWGFKIYTEGESLRVECGFENALRKAFVEFINKEIKLRDGEIEFDSDYLYAREVRTVRYEDFGAVGDGVRDDYFAIKAAHDYANEGGQTVVGTPGKTYRLYNLVNTDGVADILTIRTNVIWEGVKFIIDDTGYTHNDANNTTLIQISSDYEAIEITDKTLIEKIFSGHTVEKDFTGTLNWSDFGYGAVLLVRNANHKQFIRYGYENAGSTQKEIIVVDENGKIREETPFMFDYEDITSITVYRIDEREITISGGEFTRIASDVPQTRDDWGYFFRGLSITRSGAKLIGTSHLVTGELPGTANNTEERGAPYGGFLGINYCTDVWVEDVTLTGRKYSGIAGTYDFGAGYANNLTLYNVRQSNYYAADGKTPTMDYKSYWGIGGTNYCKNLTYDSCLLSRFDAHEGLYNGKVINSTVCNLELIGAGEMLIENTVFTPVNNPPIMLRGDYGCTWRGTLTVKDCTVRSVSGNDTILLSSGWVNHYFGYVCYFPNILIDNLKWENINTNEIYITSLANGDYIYSETLKDGSINSCLYMQPDFIKVINNKTDITYIIHNITLFENTETEGVEKR